MSLELDVRIRSGTTHGIYMLDNKTHAAIMKDETANISQIGELGWYEWDMFCDTPAEFPDDRMVLCRYLGSIIDVGLVMMQR